MTRAVRQVTWVLFALFAVLVVNLQVIGIVRADDLADQPTNDRRLVQRYESQRGIIRLGEEAAARSVRTDEREDPLAFLRRYPLEGNRAAHVVGWESIDLGRSGIEEAYDDELSAASSGLLADELAALLGDRPATGASVRLTLDPRVQAAAERALGDSLGAVVAIDPRSGAVLAHASSPTFDADLLSTHDRSAALSAWDELRADPRRPLLDRAIAERFPPGSSFKVVVAAAALEAGLADPDTAFPDDAAYDPGIGRAIRNANRGTCAGGGSVTLREAMVVSCNTTFARLGVQLGEDALRRQAQAFGFDQSIPYDLPVVESVFPRDTDDATLAQSAIGQFDTRATAMQMAVVTAAISNGGLLQRPFVVSEVRDNTDRLVSGPQSGEWAPSGFAAQAVSARTAEQLQELMVAVVEDGNGTGRRAAVPGVRVGGKTGTAQDPGDDTPTAWFTGFAEDRVAVAVVVPDAGGGGGGTVAAPIARAVMEAALVGG